MHALGTLRVALTLTPTSAATHSALLARLAASVLGYHTSPRAQPFLHIVLTESTFFVAPWFDSFHACDAAGNLDPGWVRLHLQGPALDPARPHAMFVLLAALFSMRLPKVEYRDVLVECAQVAPPPGVCILLARALGRATEQLQLRGSTSWAFVAVLGARKESTNGRVGRLAVFPRLRALAVRYRDMCSYPMGELTDELLMAHLAKRALIITHKLRLLCFVDCPQIGDCG